MYEARLSSYSISIKSSHHNSDYRRRYKNSCVFFKARNEKNFQKLQNNNSQPKMIFAPQGTFGYVKRNF